MFEEDAILAETVILRLKVKKQRGELGSNCNYFLGPLVIYVKWKTLGKGFIL